MAKHCFHKNILKILKVLKYIYELAGNISTVQGIGNIKKRSRCRARMWKIFFLFNCIFTAYLVGVVEQRFGKKKIYTQIDSTIKVSEVPFPAVGICNENYVSKRELKNIEKILTQHRIPQERRKRFYSNLQILTRRYLYAEKDGNNFVDIMDLLKKYYYDMDDIMYDIRQKCESLLVYCEFNRIPGKCNLMFKMIKTVRGFCCAFNYGGIADEGIRQVTQEDDDAIGKAGFISISESGRNSGLKVVYNVEPEDYSPSARYYGAMITLSDPNDYPETTLIQKYAPMSESIHVKVTPYILLSNTGLKQLEPTIRNCLFEDELKLNLTRRFSFETCCTECRIQQIKRRCGCVPYYYPTSDDARFCEIVDLECLRNITVYNDRVYRKEMPYGCSCLPECSDKQYKVRSDRLPVDLSDLSEKILRNVSTNNLSVLRVYYEKSTCNQYRRMLLMDWSQLVATYGGVFSLSLGASIMTIMEIFYRILQASTTLAKRTIFTVLYPVR